jgi:putative acetyltransferase
MNHSIHELQPDDLPAVTALWRRTEGVGLNESDSPENIAIYLARNPGMSFVARNDAGEIVGAVLCGHDGRRGYLHHLAVEVSHRGGGIGKALVESCFNSLRASGITRCNIFLYAENEAGRQFWLHNGWSRRADLMVMQKQI